MPTSKRQVSKRPTSKKQNANLQEAELQGANLQGANLEGANLEGANLENTQGLEVPQIQLAVNWKKALFDPEMEKSLGLSRTPVLTPVPPTPVLPTPVLPTPVPPTPAPVRPTLVPPIRPVPPRPISSVIITPNMAKKYVLEKPVYFTRIRHISGTDADVNSKKGSRTQVDVRTEGATIIKNGKSIVVIVSYSIAEFYRKNTFLQRTQAIKNTFLQRTQAIRIPAPPGYLIKKINRNRSTKFSYYFPGENHRWNDISKRPGVAGSHFSSLRVKFDGKGRDDRGNAQLKGTLKISVVLEKIKRKSKK